MYSLSLLLLLAFALPASAHMGLTPATAVGGSRTELEFRIGHDCGDDTVGTTNFTVGLPMDPPVVSVTVEQTSVWRVMMHKMMLETPVVIGTSSYNETMKSVTYLGFLPDGFHRTFKIRVRFPMVTQNTTFWFKGYQDCHNQGTSLAWASIPSEEDPSPRYPARGVVVTPAMES